MQHQKKIYKNVYPPLSLSLSFNAAFFCFSLSSGLIHPFFCAVHFRAITIPMKEFNYSLNRNGRFIVLNVARRRRINYWDTFNFRSMYRFVYKKRFHFGKGTGNNGQVNQSHRFEWWNIYKKQNAFSERHRLLSSFGQPVV